MSSCSFTAEPVEGSNYSKISLFSYDHLPLQTQWNARPVHKNLSIYSLQTIEKVLNFEVFKDDVWVITHPKCGTTWTQEMCWLLMNGMDFGQAKSVDIEIRSPCLELNVENIDKVERMQRPRLIKSHESMALLPKSLWKVKPKIIFVVRDPRDVLVSHFYHYKFFLGKTFTDEKEAFVENRMKYGGFWEQVLNFYRLKDEPYVMFMSYEEMIVDLREVVIRVSDFLGKTYPESKIDELVNHLRFDNMKNNPACSHKSEREDFSRTRRLKEEDIDTSAKFMRKGKVGTYKDELSDEMLQKINAWEQSYLEKEKLKLDDILWSNICKRY